MPSGAYAGSYGHFHMSGPKCQYWILYCLWLNTHLGAGYARWSLALTAQMNLFLQSVAAISRGCRDILEHEYGSSTGPAIGSGKKLWYAQENQWWLPVA